MCSHIQESEALARKRAVDLLQLDKRTIEAALNKTVFQGFELDALLAKITCPVLILRGNPDLQDIITEEKANYLSGNLSDFVVEYLKKCSNNEYTEQPLESVDYILNK